MEPEEYIKSLKTASEQETLNSLSSAKALYERPLSPDNPLYDNVFLTGRPTVHTNGRFIVDITDDCPVLVSPNLKEHFEKACLGLNLISFNEIIGNDTFCRFSNGAFLATKASKDQKYIMQQRGVYMHDKPEKGPISTPAALNQPIGNSDGPIQEGVLNEMQSEIAVFVQSSDGTGAFHPLRFNLPGAGKHRRGQGIDYTGMTVDKIKKFISDPDSNINEKTIPDPEKLIQNMGGIIDVPLRHSEEDKRNRYIDYTICVDGKINENIVGIPHYDTKSNIFEINQSFVFAPPKGFKITHVIGCKPTPGRMAALFSKKALEKMPVAPREVPEENLAKLQRSLGKDAAGLTRSPSGYFNNAVYDIQYDAEMTDMPDNALSRAIKKSSVLLLTQKAEKPGLS